MKTCLQRVQRKVGLGASKTLPLTLYVVEQLGQRMIMTVQIENAWLPTSRFSFQLVQRFVVR